MAEEDQGQLDTSNADPQGYDDPSTGNTVDTEVTDPAGTQGDGLQEGSDDEGASDASSDGHEPGTPDNEAGRYGPEAYKTLQGEYTRVNQRLQDLEKQLGAKGQGQEKPADKAPSKLDQATQKVNELVAAINNDPENLGLRLQYSEALSDYKIEKVQFDRDEDARVNAVKQRSWGALSRVAPELSAQSGSPEYDKGQTLLRRMNQMAGDLDLGLAGNPAAPILAYAMCHLQDANKAIEDAKRSGAQAENARKEAIRNTGGLGSAKNGQTGSGPQLTSSHLATAKMMGVDPKLYGRMLTGFKKGSGVDA